MSKKNIDSWIDHAGNVCTRRPDGSLDVSLSFKGDPGLTEQSHKELCDIEYIINRHIGAGNTLVVPPEAREVFQDFTMIPDYQECLNIVDSIDQTFATLPAKVRGAFDHRPALLMDALNDPTQWDRLVSLGILEAKKPVQGDSSTDGSIPPVVSGSEGTSTA